MVSVEQIIATINPDLYYNASGEKDEAKKELREFKELIKAEGFQKAAEKAKPKSDSEYKIVYDSSSETLEPVYFFILDMMNDMGLNTKKLVDNFTSSPGSGHFSELGQKATMMQQQGSKIMGDVNTVLRSVLNIIYDLKEFRTRLSYYNNFRSKNSDEVESARLILKQIWMDKVDILKGNSSIKAMALGQGGYQTLIDAFMVVKDEKDTEKLDLNDRVKRILMPRISEFNVWVKQSESELQKRYNLEKTYLKSQVNSLKLYSRWVKPYLKAAQALEQKDLGSSPDLVKTFNTILLELTLFGSSKINIKEAAITGDLPLDFQKLKTKRDYFGGVLVSFKFRGIPQRAAQQSHYVFGGRAEIIFKSYSLNSEEIEKFNEELDKTDVDDTLALIDGITTDSMDQLKDEINFFLDEIKEDEEEKSNSGVNPFKALIGGYDEKPKSEKKVDKIKLNIKSDDYIEKEYLRKFAKEKAEDTIFALFDVYKKAHGMASYT